MKIRLGTRASTLALTQSRHVARLLERAHKGLDVELVEINTTGDKVTGKALSSFGGAGVFVKELEIALLEKRIDLAVHSLKDMPTRQPKGLALAAVSRREDVRDAAIIQGAKSLDELVDGSVVGSGSTRRRAQLKAAYPLLAFAEIRGNVETRIRKVLEERKYAATILAWAGLKRLKLTAKAAQVLPLSLMLPAPGQGALGIECRSTDRRIRPILSALHDPAVAACVTAERAALEALGGGCHLPLGALGTVRKQGKKTVLTLRAVLGLPDGSIMLKVTRSAPLKDARTLGRAVARELIKLGGDEIIATLKAQGFKTEPERQT